MVPNCKTPGATSTGCARTHARLTKKEKIELKDAGVAWYGVKTHRRLMSQRISESENQ
jgi:hypothetical protein